MVKQKKNVPFSTRFTEGMDNALEEMADVKMLTKHDVVRNAISDYLLRNRHLIDNNIEYKENKDNLRYDEFDLITIKGSTSFNKDGVWVSGVDYYEDGEVNLIDDLVKIEVNVPEREDKRNLIELFEDMKSATEEEKKRIKESIIKITEYDVIEEYTLRYTENGLKIKHDPKFQEFLKKSIEELLEEIRKEKK